MSRYRSRPRPLIINNGPRKHVDFDPPPSIGNLSPNLQPNSPPTFPQSGNHEVLRIGKYLLTEEVERSSLYIKYKSINTITQEELVCKEFSIQTYRESLSAYWNVDSHENVNEIVEILLGNTKAYVFFEKSYGDLHSYVRNKRRLKDEEAKNLFRQIVAAVCHCHSRGLVLRDLKLRKFIFKDPQRTQLRLDGLEDASVLDDDEDDRLSDKHGCPAYVSPEILQSSECYSGRAADSWSLGVVLYTMLIGRYPFHDSEPGALFHKIRRGQYTVPDSVSSKAKCLIRSLLRLEPSERLTANQVLQHPWFHSRLSMVTRPRSDPKDMDQTVPDIFTNLDDTSFFC